MEKYYLGVDLGGTKIAVCGSNHMHEPDGIMRFPSGYHLGGADVAEELFDAVDTYIREKENDCLPAAIGFGLKDAVDYRQGIWHSCPDGDGFKDLPFARMATDRYAVPAVIDNDVHVGTLAEMVYGAGKAYQDFLYINFGTGVAFGAVIEGRLLRGSINYAGEVGHLSVEQGGEICPYCGQQGCLENIAGGKAIIEQATEYAQREPGSVLGQMLQEKGRLVSGDLFKACDMRDEGAEEIGERVVRAVMTASAGLINIFNPEAVIYGGGVMADGWLFSKIQERLPGMVLPVSRGALKKVALSSLGADRGGVFGAVALARAGDGSLS